MGDDLSVEQRIAKIRALLEDMRLHSAETREEILFATEQLLATARHRHFDQAPVLTLMPLQSRCPHCDSQNVEQMKDRSYEGGSTNTWYQCRDCKRMWSLRKNDTGQTDK